MFHVWSVSYTPPKGQCSNRNLVTALRTRFVPAILSECQAVSVRCVFDLANRTVAIEQLAARRRQLEVKLFEQNEVHCVYFIILSLYTNVEYIDSRVFDI